MREDRQTSKLLSVVFLLIAILASVTAFFPFAVNTSAWNAVTLHVPGDQGNWWHFLAGAPFFLAFALIWLSMRSLLALTSPKAERRILWSVTAITVCGTLLVEMPVLFRMGNLRQMELHRQLTLLVPGFGLLALCVTILVLRRRMLSFDSAITIALCAAYLSNATFCLGMYAPYAPQSGWYMTIAVVCLMVLEVALVFIFSFLTPVLHNPKPGRRAG